MKSLNVLLLFAASVLGQDLNYALPWFCPAVTPDAHNYSCSATFLDGTVVHGTQLSAPQVGQLVIFYPLSSNAGGITSLSVDGGTSIKALIRTNGGLLKTGDLVYPNVYSVFWNGFRWQLSTIVAAPAAVAPVTGAPLTAGQCISTDVLSANATTGSTVIVTPLGDPGDGAYFYGFVPLNGTVTIKVCAVVPLTPNSINYSAAIR